MTWRDKLEIGLKEDAPFRRDNLPDSQKSGRAPTTPGDADDRSPEEPGARQVAEVAAVKAARVMKEQSELDTGSFIAHPELRVTDDVAARTQDALGHVKGVIREAVKRGRRSAGKV